MEEFHPFHHFNGLSPHKKRRFEQTTIIILSMSLLKKLVLVQAVEDFCGCRNKVQSIFEYLLNIKIEKNKLFVINLYKQIGSESKIQVIKGE